MVPIFDDSRKQSLAGRMGFHHFPLKLFYLFWALQVTLGQKDQTVDTSATPSTAATPLGNIVTEELFVR